MNFEGTYGFEFAIEHVSCTNDDYGTSPFDGARGLKKVCGTILLQLHFLPNIVNQYGFLTLELYNMFVAINKNLLAFFLQWVNQFNYRMDPLLMALILIQYS